MAGNYQRYRADNLRYNREHAEQRRATTKAWQKANPVKARIILLRRASRVASGDFDRLKAGPQELLF